MPSARLVLRARVKRVVIEQRDDLEDMLRGWLTFGAKAAGLSEGRLAESFRVVTTG